MEGIGGLDKTLLLKMLSLHNEKSKYYTAFKVGKNERSKEIVERAYT